MRLALAIVALVLTAPAYAQPAQQFAPYTIGQLEHQWLMDHLGDVPAKWAVPLMRALEQMEQNAAAQAASEEVRKKAAAAEQKKPAPETPKPQ